MRGPGVTQRDAWQHSESGSQAAAEVHFDGNRCHAKVKINSTLNSGESFNDEAEAIAFLNREFEGARQHVLNLAGNAQAPAATGHIRTLRALCFYPDPSVSRRNSGLVGKEKASRHVQLRLHEDTRVAAAAL